MNFNFFAESPGHTPFPSPPGTFDHYANASMESNSHPSPAGTFDYYANREIEDKEKARYSLFPHVPQVMPKSFIENSPVKSANHSRLEHINNFVSQIYGSIPIPFSSLAPSAPVNPLISETERESKQKQQVSPTMSELMESIGDITSDSPSSISEDEDYGYYNSTDISYLKRVVPQTISMIEQNFPDLFKPKIQHDSPIAHAPTAVPLTHTAARKPKKTYSTIFSFSQEHISRSEQGLTLR